MPGAAIKVSLPQLRMIPVVKWGIPAIMGVNESCGSRSVNCSDAMASRQRMALFSGAPSRIPISWMNTLRLERGRRSTGRVGAAGGRSETDAYCADIV